MTGMSRTRPSSSGAMAKDGKILCLKCFHAMTMAEWMEHIKTHDEEEHEKRLEERYG